MIKKDVTINNSSGLHLRPAGVLAKAAGSCKSEITLIKGEKRVNPKSVLNVMSAQINKGDTITIEVNGENEEEDMKLIADVIENGLGD